MKITMCDWIRSKLLKVENVKKFDDFIKVGSAFCAKSSNMTRIWQKNEEVPCSTCLKPIFCLIPSTLKLDFGYPFRH